MSAATLPRAAVAGDDYLPRHSARTLGDRLRARRLDQAAEEGAAIGCACQDCGYFGSRHA